MTDFTDEKAIYYLESISRNLDEFATVIATSDIMPSIGSEVLADNRDWLTNYIDMLRKKQEAIIERATGFTADELKARLGSGCKA